MSESRSILCDTAGALFGDVGDRPLEDAIAMLDDAAFTTLLVPESEGGFGGDWGDLAVVLHLAGRHRIEAPLGDAIVARRVLTDAGVALPDGWGVLAGAVTGTITNGRFDGEVAGIAGGRSVAWVVADVEGETVLLSIDRAERRRGANMAGEARDMAFFHEAPVVCLGEHRMMGGAGAFVRAALAAGALEAALALTVDYANGRQQFGKPLARQQAVQQALAVAAMECAAVKAGVAAAAAALDRGDALFEIAAAKLRTNMAVAAVTPILHQVHGAIGFTREYPLQAFTRRLMAWRTEHGGDTTWAAVLGGISASAGPDGFWDMLVGRSDALCSANSQSCPAEGSPGQ